MPTPPNHSCRSCGACCVSDVDDVAYIDVEAADLLRMNKLQRKAFVVYTEHGARLSTKRVGRPPMVVCAAHIGTPGDSSRCVIYADRPNVCQKFEPGSRACRIAREEIGLPPLLLEKEG